MKEVLIDTDILSMFLRNNSKVKLEFSYYLDYYFSINISILTHYEILSGLEYKDAINQLKIFLKFSTYLNIIPITIESSNKSAQIYSELRKNGNIIDDVDILIAGICITNNLVLVTNNEKHFSKIKELEIKNWCI